MKLEEAIKSGKPFRRLDCDSYIECDSYGMFSWSNGFMGIVRLDKEDVLADDWEIEEEKLELTKEEIKEAYIITNLELYGQRIDTNTFYKAFIEKLGFKCK